MSKPISRTKLRQFAYTLRYEAMETCELAHKVDGTVYPKRLSALKEHAEVKKAIAVRIEEMLAE